MSEAVPVAAGGLRPTTLWFFGEYFRWRWSGFRKRFGKATLIGGGGTSGSVYPRRTLCIGRAGRGADGVCGPERRWTRRRLRTWFEGKAGEVLPGLFLVQ